MHDEMRLEMRSIDYMEFRYMIIFLLVADIFNFKEQVFPEYEYGMKE